MASLLQRLTAWFCLAVALSTGLTPANGFVICLEPDGCVSIEVETTAQACGGCGDHQEAARPTTAETRAATEDACPCLDLPIPGSSEDRRLERKPIEFRFATSFASPTSTLVQALPAPLLVRAPRDAAPRPDGTLALIRTVVLQV